MLWRSIKVQETVPGITQPLVEVQKQRSLKLSVILEKYLKALRQDGTAEKTLAERKSIVELLNRIVGDLPMHIYQRRHAQAVKKTSQKANVDRSKDYGRCRHKELNCSRGNGVLANIVFSLPPFYTSDKPTDLP